MIVEPPKGYNCPKYSNIIFVSSMTSCNTFGATIWTDGRIIGDMYCENEWLIKCYDCGTLLWCKELDKKCFGHTEELKKKDYLKKLKESGLSKEQERYLRIKAWQTGNDKRRDKDKKKELSNKDIKNLKALEKILDHNDQEDLIMKAEINRELGQFEKAASILEKSFDPKYSNIISHLKELIDKKDIFVAKIKTN